MIAALAGELSGETAKRNLEFIATQHRSRGSRGWHAAGAYVVDRLLAYGLKDARIESFPADGKRFYGTQLARLPWDADFAELWELRKNRTGWERAVRLGSWDLMPVSLAEDSESGQATADLVDVGDGTSESDYAGKDVRGKLVLAAQQPGAVQHLAVDRFGAAGIVSYAQNQRTAWRGEDENLVRWGHLDSFSATPTFGFMVSLKQGRALRQRLARGEDDSARRQGGRGPARRRLRGRHRHHTRAPIPASRPRRSPSAAISTTSGPAPTTTPAAASRSSRRRAPSPSSSPKAGWLGPRAPCDSSGRRKWKAPWPCSTGVPSWPAGSRP